MSICKKHQLLSGLFLLIYLSYQAGITLFSHTHIVNGVIVVHAHPSEALDHEHSDAQAYAIAYISTCNGDTLDERIAPQVDFRVIAKIGDEVTVSHALVSCMSGVDFRAPPFCC